MGKGITLFLVDGVPDGRIAAELFNWTGKAFKIPRNQLSASQDRAELRKAGIYLLLGRDDADPDSERVYVGEAEDVFRRLLQHRDKDFWTEAVAVVSKDENLNKAHAKFLEFRTHEAIELAGRASLENGNTPTCPVISELEQAVMSDFFENLQLLVSTLGFKGFEPLVKSEQRAERAFQLKGPRGASARVVVTNEGVVVLEGSHAAGAVVPSAPPLLRAKRNELIETGTLAKAEDGSLVFTKDHLFGSPSAAADIVLGRSANGRTELKDASGVSLKEHEEAEQGDSTHEVGDA